MCVCVSHKEYLLTDCGENAWQISKNKHLERLYVSANLKRVFVVVVTSFFILFFLFSLLQISGSASEPLSSKRLPPVWASEQKLFLRLLEQCLEFSYFPEIRICLA